MATEGREKGIREFGSERANGISRLKGRIEGIPDSGYAYCKALDSKPERKGL